MIFFSFLKSFPRILFCMFRSEDKQYLHDFYKPFTCKELCGGLNVGIQLKLFRNSVLAPTFATWCFPGSIKHPFHVRLFFVYFIR